MVRCASENGDDRNFPVWEVVTREHREAVVAPGDGVGVGHSEDLDERKDSEVWRRCVVEAKAHNLCDRLTMLMKRMNRVYMYNVPNDDEEEDEP